MRISKIQQSRQVMYQYMGVLTNPSQQKSKAKTRGGHGMNTVMTLRPRIAHKKLGNTSQEKKKNVVVDAGRYWSRLKRTKKNKMSACVALKKKILSKAGQRKFFLLNNVAHIDTCLHVHTKLVYYLLIVVIQTALMLSILLQIWVFFGRCVLRERQGDPGKDDGLTPWLTRLSFRQLRCKY